MLERINDKVTRISIEEPGRGNVNVYAIVSDIVTLIDCGYNSPHSRSSLHADLAQLGLHPSGVDQIVLTHRHPDHAGGAAGSSLPWGQARMIAFPVPDQLPLSPSSISTRKRYMPESLWSVLLDANGTAPPPDEDSSAQAIRFDRLVQDGETVDIGGGKLTVLHTPGHCADHISLMGDDGVLFGGDAVLHNGPPALECLDSYTNSIGKIAACQAAAILPGHGSVIDRQDETIARTLNRLEATDKKLLAAVRRGIDAPFGLALECTEGRIHRGLLFWLDVVLVHLFSLERRGDIHLTRSGEIIESIALAR
ncbi:MBL fold metallo-hydrolase [Paenibacillus ginsengarvi]|uniref:MBL fold metallo-hydrolase n=1 Tax=Paenibacillus ginsengarvi TaxID=400777 RepID=A0A3B0C896_9BACL|nr:MBL fold metallo-hydrolase [Paenibacillus ginsengarvi]RKN79126.1 MBL fold metallo-hydrolase [Paenibacillus ginsengarvi]